MQREVTLPNGRSLMLGYTTTHIYDSGWGSRDFNRYVSRIWFNRSDGYSYVVMAYADGKRPSARQPYWGIYRVEEWPGGYYFAEGNYTLLKGEMTRREALTQIELVATDPGHQHQYWTDESIIHRYRDGTSRCLTAFCQSCSQWIFNERVERLIKDGQIEIKPDKWWLKIGQQNQL